ncbi:hypothetical protein [Streptomyces agglomeratus]|uniref:hypothetical protein n=1 Tax=Streptomyces agglomeratus TaxID=285458 RepID=UPI00210EEBE9|nr:hypothetical protein [Streptomyces agglomeratus]
MLATVDRVVAASARGPLTVGAGADVFRIDDSQFLFSSVGDDTDPTRAFLGEQLSVLNMAAQGAAPTTLSPKFAATLRYLLHGGDEPSGGSTRSSAWPPLAIPGATGGTSSATGPRTRCSAR